jgi:hypothetical protein
MAEKRANRYEEEDREKAKNQEPLVTVTLPDDDTLEATFQELQSALRAVYTSSDKGAIVVFPKLGGVQSE